MVPAILAALGEAGGAGAAGMGAEMASLGNATQRFQNSITQLPNQVLRAEASIVHMGSTLVNVLAAPIDTIERLGQSMARFVQLSNPAAVTIFEFRIGNALASVGKIVEPILNALGRAADKANEAFSKAGPAFGSIVDATVDLVDTVGNSLVPAFRELAPWIKIAGDNAQTLVGGMKAVGEIMSELNSPFLALNGLVRQLVGGFDENATKSTAVRPVGLRTSEQIQRELSERSIQASIAGGQGPKQTTESLLQQIMTFLNLNLSKAQLLTIVKAIGTELSNLIPDLPGPGAVRQRGGIVAADIYSRILSLIR